MHPTADTTALIYINRPGRRVMPGVSPLRYAEVGQEVSVATEYEMPAFGEAVQQFGGFLVSQGLSSDLLWVFREDVCWRKQQLFVKVPVPEGNVGDVERLYNLGVARGLGVRLDVLCLLSSRPCCYVWL